MDRCLEITGELCDYCCLVDFEWCSRDIYNCEPIRDRNLDAMKDCIYTLAAIIFGFPVLGGILYQCVMRRFCTSCYPDTSGISLLECFCRSCYFWACCGRRFTMTYNEANQEDDDGGRGDSADNRPGCCKRIFCCCCLLCCCRGGKGKGKAVQLKEIPEGEE